MRWMIVLLCLSLQVLSNFVQAAAASTREDISWKFLDTRKMYSAAGIATAEAYRLQQAACLYPGRCMPEPPAPHMTMQLQLWLQLEAAAHQPRLLLQHQLQLRIQPQGLCALPMKCPQPPALPANKALAVSPLTRQNSCSHSILSQFKKAQ